MTPCGVDHGPVVFGKDIFDLKERHQCGKAFIRLL
jgi:hypothetical protein